MFQVIKSRLEESKDQSKKPERIDLLQTLLNLYSVDKKEAEKSGIFSQVFGFMLAGHETTSLTMTWTIYLLSKYPEIQDKVRKEISSVLKSQTEIRWEDIDKLKYLDNCIRESLRMYPPGPFVGREPVKEEKFGPYTIPANTTLFVNFASLQRDPEFWTDPNVFNPDRFQSIGK